MEPTNRRRVVRALEVTLGSGRPFSSLRPRPRRLPADAVHAGRPPACRAELVADADRAPATTRQMAAGFLDEVRAPARPPGGLSRTARQALGYKELLAHLDGELAPRRGASTWPSRRTRRFARRQRALVPPRPPHHAGSTRRRPDGRRSSRPAEAADARLGQRPDRGTAGDGRMRLTKHHGLGNDFLVLLDLDGTAAGVAGRRRRAAATAAPASAPTGSSRVTAGRRRRRRHRWSCCNADGSRAEMSGNGIRCLAQAVVQAGVAGAAGPRASPPTPGCARSASRPATTPPPHAHAASTWARPRSPAPEPELGRRPTSRRPSTVDVGNPHLVLRWSTTRADRRRRRSRRAAHRARPSPAASTSSSSRRTDGDGELDMVVYERGVGLTAGVRHRRLRGGRRGPRLGPGRRPGHGRTCPAATVEVDARRHRSVLDRRRHLASPIVDDPVAVIGHRRARSRDGR